MFTKEQQYVAIAKLGAAEAALEGAFQPDAIPFDTFVSTVNGNGPDEDGNCVVYEETPWTFRLQAGSAQSNTYQPANRDHHVLVFFSSVPDVNINLVDSVPYRASPLLHFKVVNEAGRVYFGGQGIIPAGGAYLTKGQVATVMRVPTGWVVQNCEVTLPQD